MHFCRLDRPEPAATRTERMTKHHPSSASHRLRMLHRKLTDKRINTCRIRAAKTKKSPDAKNDQEARDSDSPCRKPVSLFIKRLAVGWWIVKVSNLLSFPSVAPGKEWIRLALMVALAFLQVHYHVPTRAWSSCMACSAATSSARLGCSQYANTKATAI